MLKRDDKMGKVGQPRLALRIANVAGSLMVGSALASITMIFFAPISRIPYIFGRAPLYISVMILGLTAALIVGVWSFRWTHRKLREITLDLDKKNGKEA
jgi:TctA family transporter